MNIDTQYLETFGIWGFLVVVFTTIFVPIITSYFSSRKTSKTIDKIPEKLSETIFSQNDKLTTSLVKITSDNNDLLKEILIHNPPKEISKQIINDNNLHHDSKNMKRYEIESRINENLKTLLTNYKACRVFIIEIHNSKENLNNLSILHYDVTYDMHCKEVGALDEKDRKLSDVTPFTSLVHQNSDNIKVFNKDEFNLLNDDELTRSGYQHLRNLHFNEVVYCGIYSSSNVLLGLLVVGFSDLHPMNKNIDFDILKNALKNIEKEFDIKHPFGNYYSLINN